MIEQQFFRQNGEKEELKNELVIYCSDTLECYNDEEIDELNKNIRKKGQEELIRDNLNKYVVKIKTSDASFWKLLQNYILYKDEGLSIYDVKERKKLL